MKSVRLVCIFLFLSGIAGAQSLLGSTKTITIGRQVWMMENLKVVTFKNGVVIPEVKDRDAWLKASYNKQPAWCYYENEFKNVDEYGRLYNWYAVIDTNGICPQGWHVPTDSEWDTLINYLGGRYVAEEKMKIKPITEKIIDYEYAGGYYETKWVSCSNCSYWTEKQLENIPCNVCKNTRGKSYRTGKYIPKTKRKIEYIETIGGWNGTNQSLFSGLPGGSRDEYGNYHFIGSKGFWWSSTAFNSNFAWYRYLDDSNGNAGSYNGNKNFGFSVRCLKD